MSYLPSYIVRFVVLIVLSSVGAAGTMPNAQTMQGTDDWNWTTPLPGGRIEDSSPAFADLDGDGNLEVVVGTTADPDGASPALVVLNHDGSVKWSRRVDHPIRSSPAVVDISSPPDGIPEIIITTGGDVDPPAEGAVVAYDRCGNRLWRYETHDAEGTDTPNGNWSSPTVGDLDRDGNMEIVFGSWDRNIYLLDHNGGYVWHYHVGDTVWSTAALADFDKDGYLEIVIGTDITGGGVLPDGYRPTDGGFVLILDRNGNKLARRQLNETVFSSPAVGDTNDDGQLEVFVGTGMYYYKRENYSQPYVYGFRVDTSGTEWQLEDLPGWPQPVAYPGMSSPALADLDDDGDLEVVIGTGHEGGSRPSECSGSASDPECYGAVYAWHHSGTPVTGFPSWPQDAGGRNAFIRSSPTVADVDGDGEMEILVSMNWDVVVMDRHGSRESVLHTRYSLFGSPAIGDLDRDGQTDVVIGGSNYQDDGRGHVYGFEFAPNSFSATLNPWPVFHRDARNTGRYPLPPQLHTSPESMYVMHQYGSGNEEHRRLDIQNVGDGALAWEVSSTPSEVTVDPTSGTASSSTPVVVTVRPTGYATGTYSLGNIEITGEADGEPVQGSPVQVPVTLYVGDVHGVYLPLSLRSVP